MNQPRKLSLPSSCQKSIETIFLITGFIYCSGLDIVSINQLMNLLRKLARQGRTIICTIHQPTASQFEQFDHVYVLSRGVCVYQGASDQMVPFLSSVGLECPKSHNPADYSK